MRGGSHGRGGDRFMHGTLNRIVLDVFRVALAAAVVATTAPCFPQVSEAKTLDPLSTSTGKRFAQRSSEVEIPRFAEIGPGLTRGGDPGEEGLTYLHKKGY